MSNPFTCAIQHYSCTKFASTILRCLSLGARPPPSCVSKQDQDEDAGRVTGRVTIVRFGAVLTPRARPIANILQATCMCTVEIDALYVVGGFQGSFVCNLARKRSGAGLVFLLRQRDRREKGTDYEKPSSCPECFRDPFDLQALTKRFTTHPPACRQ